MFRSCLSYNSESPSSSSPVSISQELPKELPKEQLKIGELPYTAFIFIEGIMSDTPDSCINVGSTFFCTINYDSKGIFNDFKNLNIDAAFLNNVKAEVINRKERINKIKNVINYFLDNNFNIILVGGSHGSLLIHVAYIQLLCECKTTVKENFIKSKIHLISIGSPRHFPKGINDIESKLGFPRVLNFYHQKDTMIKILSSINFGKFMVPSLPFVHSFFSDKTFYDEAHGKLSVEKFIGRINNQDFKVNLKDLRVVEKDFEWIDPLYFFDENKGIVYVNKLNILPTNFKTNAKIVNFTEAELQKNIQIAENELNTTQIKIGLFGKTEPINKNIIIFSDVQKKSLEMAEAKLKKAKEAKITINSTITDRFYFLTENSSLALYHVHPAILYPIFDHQIRILISDHGAYNQTKIQVSGLDNKPSGGRPKNHIISIKTKKKYLVRYEGKKKYILIKNKSKNIIKVFLSDLRGKYRYL